MVKNREINGTEEIALVTPTPGRPYKVRNAFQLSKNSPNTFSNTYQWHRGKTGVYPTCTQGQDYNFHYCHIKTFQPVYEVFTHT